MKYLCKITLEAWLLLSYLLISHRILIITALVTWSNDRGVCLSYYLACNEVQKHTFNDTTSSDNNSTVFSWCFSCPSVSVLTLWDKCALTSSTPTNTSVQTSFSSLRCPMVNSFKKPDQTNWHNTNTLLRISWCFLKESLNCVAVTTLNVDVRLYIYLRLTYFLIQKKYYNTRGHFNKAKYPNTIKKGNFWECLQKI